MAVLNTRQYNICYDNYGRAYQCGSSSWYNWGRWVALGCIVAAAILFFFLFSCLTARRRRKFGRQPMWGTGWAAPGHGAAQYNPNYNTQQPPHKPEYSQNQDYQPPSGPPPSGGYYGGNQSYYGQQNAYEMQQPQQAYRGGEEVYQPPPGPPPNKAT